MPNFIVSTALRLYNSFKGLWFPQDLKRRRDSFDEEDESDVFRSFRDTVQTPNKRPRLTALVHMEADEDVQFVEQRDLQSAATLTKSRYKNRFKASPDEREDVSDVEIVENSMESETRARQSLKEQPQMHINGTTPQGFHLPKFTDRKPSRSNGIGRSNRFTSSLRLSAKNSIPKTTAIDQAVKVDEKTQYSKMLQEYMSSQRPALKLKETQSPQSGNVQEEIDLTGSSPILRAWKSVDHDLHHRKSFHDKGLSSLFDSCERAKGSRGGMLVQIAQAQSLPRKTQVVVTPWKNQSAHASVSSQTSDSLLVSAIVPRVNSMERRLASNPVTRVDWIQELVKNYNEKEMEKKKQLEDTQLKRDIYAKHNAERRWKWLEERIQKHLKITDVVLNDVEELPSLPRLTSEMNEKIDSALRPQPTSQVLVQPDTTGDFKQSITRGDIQTLKGLNWLNDEVINFYMTLINVRSKLDNYPNVYAFNTFFYPKLTSQGYTVSLARWTKKAKVDIYTLDMVLVPIHLGIHWCMSTIDFRDKTIRYYDSMGKSNDKCLNALLMYLNEEHKNKHTMPYDTSDWKTENVKDIPHQMNGSDCGVFSSMFAEYLSRNAKITFSQKDMPYFRRKMVYEILTKQLLQ